MRLTEFFLILEAKDRLEYLVQTFQKKLLKKFLSDHEAKKLRGSTVNAILKGITQGNSLEAAKDIVEYFARHDPSTNNKYTDWILRQWLSDKLLWEDAYKMKELLPEFEKYRKKLETKDINGYKDYRKLEDDLQPHIGTEVAGVRVKNFMNKDTTKELLRNTTADPDHPDVQKAIEKDREESEEAPQWFQDAEYENYEDMLETEMDVEDFYDEAESYLDKDEYTDEDGEVDQESWDMAVTNRAEELRQQAIRNQVEEFVSTEIDERWAEYRAEHRDELQQQLRNAPQVPALVPVYESDRLVVLEQNSQEAACYVGKGTKWCTSAEEGENNFWEYRPAGPLYAVLTDKMGKFQFHFEAAQYMDEQDRPIENSGALQPLVKTYPELREAFQEKGRKFYELWLVPVDRITDLQWETLYSAIMGDKDDLATVVAGRDEEYHWNDNDYLTLMARTYLGHKDRGPKEWMNRYRAALMEKGRHTAFEKGWISKDDLDDTSLQTLLRNFHSESENKKESLVQWLFNNNVELPKETWHYLASTYPRAVMYMPTEYLDKDVISKAIRGKEEPRTPLPGIYHGRSAIPLFNFMQQYSFALATEKATPLRDRVLANGKKIISLVDENDIQESLRDEDGISRLQYLEDFFGDYPWMYAIAISENDSRELATIADQLARYLQPMLNKGIRTKLNRDKIINALLMKRPDRVDMLAKFVETPNGLAGVREKTMEMVAAIAPQNWRRAEAILNNVSDWLMRDDVDQLWAIIRQEREKEVNAELAKKRAYAGPAGYQPGR